MVQSVNSNIRVRSTPLKVTRKIGASKRCSLTKTVKLSVLYEQSLVLSNGLSSWQPSLTTRTSITSLKIYSNNSVCVRGNNWVSYHLEGSQPGKKTGSSFQPLLPGCPSGSMATWFRDDSSLGSSPFDGTPRQQSHQKTLWWRQSCIRS